MTVIIDAKLIKAAKTAAIADDTNVSRVVQGLLLRVFTLLHDARPVLLNLGEKGDLDVTPWADRVKLIDAGCVGTWELPVLGAVTAPKAVLIRPDGYVAWAGELTPPGLARALTSWFGPPAAAL